MTHSADVYEDLSDALLRIHAAAEAAESHGLLCGLICVAGRADREQWILQVLGDDQDPSSGLVREARKHLETLYAQTLAQIYEESFAWQMLLPDEDAPMEDRLLALSEWCQGFLLGFSTHVNADTGQLPEEIRELVEDFIELTRMDIEVDQETEEDEQAYLEIAEYVRVGVLYILETLSPKYTSPNLQ